MQVCCPPHRPSLDDERLPVGVAAALTLVVLAGVTVDGGREKEDEVATRLAAGALRYQLALGSPKQSPIVTPL